MLGNEATKAEIAAWDKSVFPDGEGLPDGKGSVAEGEVIYQQQCLSCHGENGLGTQLGDQLAGAQMGLTSDYPEKTIGTSPCIILSNPEYNVKYLEGSFKTKGILIVPLNFAGKL